MQFIQFVGNYYSSPTEQERHRNKLDRRYTKIPEINGTTGYLKVLFQYLKEENINGISIYKADDQEFSSWSKLEYDNVSNDIKEKPCK
ncbi:MAG: hypothetical protein DI539_00330 [Flavobacterium psychrophilum]|nr:MAG: hypothetical protein DI539_00330 [Flavobacterium psychrophilum]